MAQRTYRFAPMARRTRVIIRQSLDDLQACLRNIHPDLRKRVQMVILLKEDPTLSNKALADRLRVGTASISRWIGAHGKGGLKRLLNPSAKGGDRPPRVDNAIVREMRELDRSGEVRGTARFHRWLTEAKGISYTRSGVRDLLKKHGLPTRAVKKKPSSEATKPGASRGAVQRKNPRSGRKAIPGEQVELIDGLVKFAELLPRKYDVVDVIEAIRRIVVFVIPNVDRVSIDVNTSCPLLNSGEYHPDVAVSQVLLPGTIEPILSIRAATAPGAYATNILNGFKEQKLNIEIYHPPVWREYYCHETMYLGTVLLWQDRAKPERSDDIGRGLDRLRPLITHLLTEVVLRHHHARPTERAFRETIREIVVAYGIGKQEMLVLIERLYGRSNKEIARELMITVETVKKHIASFLRKTRSRNVLELFARHFTTRLRGHR